MEFSGYDSQIPPSRIRMLLDSSTAYLNEPLKGSIQGTWYGWRPMTQDTLPIIGPAPALSNVLLAVGHNMLGLTLAASTGRLIAEQMSGSKPHIDPTPFCASRFA